MAVPEPVQSKVWPVFFRHARVGMLALNLGSKLVAICVILLLVNSSRNSSTDDASEPGVQSTPTFRSSRRVLREFVPPATCPYDFSKTPFPMALSLCSLPDAWSESCCTAIKHNFWEPVFGDNTETIPDACIEAVEARLLREQIHIKYSAVCNQAAGVLSDPLLRGGQHPVAHIETAPEGAQFETVVSQLVYSEESEEEIPSDTRPEEESELEEALELESGLSPEQQEQEPGRDEPFLLRREENRSQLPSFDAEGLALLGLDKILPAVVSV